MEDSTLWGMGEGHFGRLGDGTTSVNYSPLQTVSGGVTQASAGNEHTMFVKEDGSLWGTGLNWFGQLGDGTGENHSAPVQILSEKVTQVAAGRGHTMYVKEDGSLMQIGRHELWRPIPIGMPLDFTAHPVLSPIGHQRTDSDKTLVLQLSATISDGSTLHYIASVDKDEVLANVNGSILTLTPQQGWKGEASITVFAKDEHGRFDSETFRLRVYRNYFSQADIEALESTLAVHPADSEANFQYVIRELVDVFDSTIFKSLLTDIGITGDMFTFTASDLVYDGIPSDMGFSLDRDFQVDALRSYVLDDLLPLLESMEVRFSTLPSGGTVLLYEDTEFGQGIDLDYADSLVIRAMIWGFSGFLKMKMALGDWDYPVSVISSLYDADMLTLESLLEAIPNLLEQRDTPLLQSASADFKAAVDNYLEASPLLRSRSRTTGLFSLGDDDLANEAELVSELTKLKQSLKGAQPWGDDVTDPVFVNLKPFFDGEVDLANLLPKSVGNKFWDEPLPDPTFGGVFPVMTENRAREYMSEAGMFTDNLWIGIEPLQPELRSGNLDRWSWNDYGQETGLWWRSHWFGMFYKPAPVGWPNFQERIFPTEWMFHMRLGWVYPGLATPDSVWFWQDSSESWMWTNRDIFPVMYSHTSGLWFYIDQDDGSQYLWVNSERVKFK